MRMTTLKVNTPELGICLTHFRTFSIVMFSIWTFRIGIIWNEK